MPTRYVLAPSGLNLRRSADPKSEILATLPFGASVFLADGTPGEEFSVDHLPGRMVPALKDTTEGYLFDGYLSHLAPPKPFREGNKWDYLRQFAEDHSDEGVVLHLEQDEFSARQGSLFLPNASMASAFLLGKILFFIPGEYLYPLEQHVTLSTQDAPSKAAQESPYSHVEQFFTWETDPDTEADMLAYYDESEVGGRKITWKPGPEGITIHLESWTH